MAIYECDFFDRADRYQGKEFFYNRRVARVEVLDESRIPFALTDAGFNVEKILRIRRIVTASDPSLDLVVQAKQCA